MRKEIRSVFIYGLWLCIATRNSVLFVGYSGFCHIWTRREKKNVTFIRKRKKRMLRKCSESCIRLRGAGSRAVVNSRVAVGM